MVTISAVRAVSRPWQREAFGWAARKAKRTSIERKMFLST
jgi:hypothetical protein